MDFTAKWISASKDIGDIEFALKAGLHNEGFVWAL